MSATITATGNAGFHVAAPGVGVFIDAFWDGVPRLLGGYRPGPAPPLPADLILVTHSHWDHFDPSRVAEAAARTGAAVVGPADVIRPLRGRVSDKSLAEMEPSGPAGSRRAPRPGRGAAAASATVQVAKATVTAFRTYHGRGHNSYLVRAPGFAFFHDGDNEDTRPLDPASLAPVDALLLCPWQGSGWPEFVERLSPRRWFLIHMTEEEIAQHRAGRFLPDLCARVPLPDRIVALAPGEALVM